MNWLNEPFTHAKWHLEHQDELGGGCSFDAASAFLHESLARTDLF